MKKTSQIRILAALLALTVLCASGCRRKTPTPSTSAPEQTAAPAESTSAPETQTPPETQAAPSGPVYTLPEQEETKPHVSVENGTQRVAYTAPFDLAALITSADGLSRYTSYAIDGSDKWDDAFFEENDLILVGYNTDSSSARPYLTAIVADGKTYSVEAACPDLNEKASDLSDLSSWIMWAAVPKNASMTAVKLINPSIFTHGEIKK